jgi:hypothetical protein
MRRACAGSSRSAQRDSCCVRRAATKLLRVYSRAAGDLGAWLRPDDQVQLESNPRDPRRGREVWQIVPAIPSIRHLPVLPWRENSRNYGRDTAVSRRARDADRSPSSSSYGRRAERWSVGNPRPGALRGRREDLRCRREGPRERPDRGAVLLIRVGTWGNGYSNFTDAPGKTKVARFARDNKVLRSG